jgi:glycosyltransferase involved in cell wall biosynthesis
VKGLNHIVLDNPNRTAPYAFNIGIENSTGEIIVILSAHAVYKSDYISNGVRHLMESDAANVGGYLTTVGRGKLGKSIAAILSSKFGVGGSDFRVSKETKYVDTVPFGTFRRSLVDEIGGFNVNLPRNEDNEFNYRIGEHGGKLLMVSDMEIIYYCRETASELVKMGYANGCGVGFTAVKYPKVLKFKYFVPLLFVLSLVFLLTVSIFTGSNICKALLFTELAAYVLLDLFFTFKAKENAKIKLNMLWLFPTFHISYGLGTIKGLYKGIVEKRNGSKEI